MDHTTKYVNPSPILRANCFSKLVFWWIVPLFKYGKDHDLEIKDLHNALPADHSNALGDKLERNWKKEYEDSIKTGKKPKLLTAIKKTFFLSTLHYGAWLLFHSAVLRTVQPYILGLLIWHFDPRSGSSAAEAYAYASAIVCLSIFIAVIQHHTYLGHMEVGMRLRIACSSLVYRKILRLSRSAANETAGGLIINLLSNDVARFDQLFVHLHYIWIMPIQGALVAYLIWQSVQIASLAGIFLITIQTIPFQGYMGKITSKLRMKVAIRTDERVRLMSEIISGIKVIKMYTWEKPFELLVSCARKYEIDILTLTSYLRGFNKATFVFTERTTLFFTVMAYVLLGNDISAAQVFSMAQYFNIIQATMAIYYPMAISAGAEALVSISRLEKFLLLEEKKSLEDWRDKNKMDGEHEISMKHVTASWSENSIGNTLHDVTLSVKKGGLCALIGPVGSGKTSLLQLVLGELKPREGHVIRGGTISYASQEPWLFAGSVRNNILFGLPYDEARYKRVTRACALVKDFVQLPQGDKSLVGEQGTSLSGGQRARINLARAVYAEADIYLLDDPLSAVDPHVGKQLFEDCIMGYLAKKTRILVTHQVHHLKSVDHIVMLNNGVVTKQGSYREFQESHSDLIKAISPEEEECEEKAKNDKSPVKDSRQSSIHERSVSISNQGDDDRDNEEPQETEELMAKGQMLQSLYWKYFSTGNSIFMILLFFVFTLFGQLGSSGCDYWVAYWTNQQELRLKKEFGKSTFDGNSSVLDLANSTESGIPANVTFPNSFQSNWADFNFTGPADESGEYLDRDTALWIYGGFIIASVVMTSARNLAFFKICMNSNRKLHDTMFARLLRAPMRFFDTNPSGRILNRFSKDVGSVDEILPTTMLDSIQIFAVLVGILGQVVIIYWWSIFPMFVMALLYGKIRNVYLATARDIKRLEGVGKSPVFSHVNSSLSGLATIRSAGRIELVKKEFDSHQDLHTGAYYLSIATSTAFGLWLDAVTIAFVAFITYAFVFLESDSTFSGNVGLAISQILILCGMLQHGVRQTSEMVAQMTSVERILEFANLECEDSVESEKAEKPPGSWPSKGKIVFSHVYLRYDESSELAVLSDINVEIEAGSKVGIVGRTGAGKSSIITALFGLSKIEGNIYIDDVDTKKLGLKDVRKKMSIIPQEPVLFSSSLRDNLDPFREYEDVAVWSSLEQVQLKNAVPSLEHCVTHGGTNFSAGQRQLLCLARAILRNNKILVLDEATANVDPSTDRLIQETVRTNFQHCTVLTIAHRLNTIMDSDKILVLDRGRVIEYDHPHLLLQKPQSVFKEMLQQTGPAASQTLANISKQAYESKQPAKT